MQASSEPVGRWRLLPWLVSGIVVLALLWGLASRLVAAEIILPGPIPTLFRLGTLVLSPRFLFSLGTSFLRVMLGVLFSVPLALAVGIVAGLDSRINAFLRPFFALVSATPVLSIILIAVLWFGQEGTATFTAFLIIFPVMVANTVEGIRATDPRLRETLRVYRCTRYDTLRHLYLPSLLPFIVGGLRASLSLSWKVVVAAEVIVQPLFGLGTGMQNAKAQLETTELFAWTAATVISAALSELVLTLLQRRSRRHGDAL